MASLQSEHVVPNDVPINQLSCRTAFDALTPSEKQYAHYLCQASFHGGLIVLLQTSEESTAIYLILQKLLTTQSIQSLHDGKPESVTEEDFQAFLVYAAAVFTNMGIYRSFGDNKIVPGLAEELFKALVESSVAYHNDPPEMAHMLLNSQNAIYCLDPRDRELAFPPKGRTAYYTTNCRQEDAEFVQGFMTEKGISPYNTRLFKKDVDDVDMYEVIIASVARTRDPISSKDRVAPLLGEHMYKGKSIRVTRGDYSPLLERVVDNLQKAKRYAANENEASMLEFYISSFMTGSIEDHKDGSRHWIRNKGPIVEFYIGFIESYRDPLGVRGEFEGFVAMVNKEMSRKFGKLVSQAEQLLPLLPWPREYEKDTFLKPDFTSLDVLAFSGSGIPSGINIPNYNDIRQNEGFKNVSLGNVLSASAADKRVSFLSEADQELYLKLKGPAFEVQVGLHELTGHGSGKLFKEEEDGTLNFKPDDVRHTETNEPIKSWYGPHDTWDTKFSTIASTYEECRAECVGIYLCLSRDILSIFGHEGDAASDIIYINWLNMVRAGILALEYYSPETNNWRQAHMQGRYVILQVLLEAGDGLVNVSKSVGDDGQPDLVLHLDRLKIETVGKKAIGDFLRKLQVYKATADVDAGTAMYEQYSRVSEENGGWLSLRKIVMARKTPRRMFVQPHTILDEATGDVQLVEFPATAAGIVESFITRFPVYDQELDDLWHMSGLYNSDYT